MCGGKGGRSPPDAGVVEAGRRHIGRFVDVAQVDDGRRAQQRFDPIKVEGAELVRLVISTSRIRRVTSLKV